MLSFKAVLGVLFGLLVVTIAILGVVSYRNNDDVTQASFWVHRSYQVIQKADEIVAGYKDVQLKMNAAFAVQGASQPASYRAAKTELFSDIEDLRKLAQDSGQQPKIDSLESVLRIWIGLADSLTVAVASVQDTGTLPGKSAALVNEITRKINTIKTAEKQLLTRRESANQKSIAAFERAFAFLLIGIAVLLTATFFLIRYHFNKRMRAQQELKRANVLFEKVFYESPIAIVISELDSGKILNCNRVFAATVNYDVKDLIGRTAVELGIFESRQQRQGIIAGAGQKGTSKHAEVYIRPRDREPIYISLHAHAIPLYDRKCLLTAVLDLSTHKRAEDEIKRALEAEIELNRLKSNFVTLASHEFRTPLTTILSSTFLLENYSFGENQDKAGKHLMRIKSSVNNLTSMLDEFLSVTKIEDGQVEPHLKIMDLPVYLQTICGNLQTCARPGQTIHYSHSGENEVKMDPVLLGNIISNLVMNSIKYSSENSPIYVSSNVNSRIHLSVRDKGIGIPEPDQQHLFERFYRASNAGAVQGTGLGLHIMKHYVAMLKGSVKLQSELGKGTQVEVTFDHIR